MPGNILKTLQNHLDAYVGADPHSAVLVGL